MKNLIYVLGLVFIFSSCAPFQVATLFDEPQKTAPPESIGNFYGLSIMDDELNGDFWHEENTECYKVERVQGVGEVGEYAIRVTWDKDKGVCDWIGMGWGWNGWMAKDMQAIVDSAALSFKVKPVKGEFSNLPIAVSFEDYSEKGAWLGFNPNCVVKEKSLNGWTQIEMPMSEFNWREQGANPANLKQLIMQLEATGDFYFDDIKIVPRVGGFKKRINSKYFENSVVNIGSILEEKEWNNASTINLDGNTIKIFASNNSLFLAGTITDKTPLENSKLGNELWDGDAIEVCMRSTPGNKTGSVRLSSVDIHAIFSMSANPKSWIYNKGEVLNNYNLATSKTSTGYSFELEIPLAEFGVENLFLEQVYAFEIAIDEGNNQGRKSQVRWNAVNNPDFYTNPSVWGEIVFLKQNEDLSNL
jgi:hypothetical protein